MTDLVVAGGTVVTSDGSRIADVAITDGRIAAIGPDLAAGVAPVIDARGLLVLPGAVDVHTHLRLPTEAHPERFRQDTLAAARGGTTTVLTFNNPGTGISDEGAASPMQGMREFRERTAGESAVDYGLSAVLSGQQADPIGELPELIAAGVPTVKAFMVYDFRLPDDELERAMRTAAGNGGMLQVHCEEPAIIDPLVQEALAAHHTSCRHHALTRPRHATRIPARYDALEQLLRTQVFAG